ncbi:MAG: aspartate carbamoyltransferase catalytic subunit [Candidatus Geothermincolales bacterium]
MFRNRGKRDLLDVDQLDRAEIESLLESAEAFEEVLRRPIKKVPALRGKTVVNLFYEPSTRTRMSFELAAKSLSADVLNFSASSSSVEKGESLKDTGLTVQAMGADALVVRHPMAGAPDKLAEWLDIPVINAGDGMHAHPTQALLDIYVMRKRLGALEGKRVTFVGDILHSRVARSGIKACSMMGMEVAVAAPPTFLPDWLPSGVEVFYRLDDVLRDSHVIYLLRIQRERQVQGFLPSLEEYVHFFQLNEERLGKARPDVLVMHPGPMNRGVEITPKVAESPQSLVDYQVTCGVAVRMAILFLLLGGSGGA